MTPERRYQARPPSRDQPHALHLILILILTLASAVLLLSLTSCRQPTRTVTLYAAQDRVYAEPILQEFERETGIRVLALYDNEAVKTVGLANRLLAERHHPRCDVFWGNEEFRTRQLAALGLFRETNGWVTFGHRSRRIVVHTNLAGTLPVPGSLIDLTNPIYRGRISMANPLFGTTATHFMVLRNHWGDEAWKRWCLALAANDPYLEEGNSHVARRLARGEALIGLTDSDDLAAADREGIFRGRILPLDGDSLLIPNTVALIRNSPHPHHAQQLLDYLSQPSIARHLVEVRALEGAELPSTMPRTLQPDWEHVIDQLESSTQFLQETFLR